jgi:alkylation response protein AidB-like acyl-CoA dehydrogenase
VIFNGVQVGADAVLGEVDNGFDLLEQVLDHARIALAAEMLGSATQAFEVTLDYLKTRTQFGQVIGTFQALQHRAAKMFTDLELTRSCVEAGPGRRRRQGQRRARPRIPGQGQGQRHLPPRLQRDGPDARRHRHDRRRRPGLYMKRARVTEAAFGSSSYHRDRYARLGGF